MPTVAQIEQALFQLAPKDLAFDWDTVSYTHLTLPTIA